MKIAVMTPSGATIRFVNIRALSVGGKDQELILLRDPLGMGSPVRFNPDEWASFKGERELYPERRTLKTSGGDE